MSMVRRYAMERLLERRDVAAKITGQSWPDYDNSKPLRDNLQRIYPDAQAIFWYKPVGDDPVKLIEPANRQIPACASYNECWWDGWLALRECQDTHTELVVCHHQNDIARITTGPGWIPKVVHIAHAGYEKVFAKNALPWEQRDIPALLTGAISDDTYPLRAKFRRLIASGKIPGTIRQHPSYLLGSLESCNRQADDYARQLGRSKAVYLCASKYQYGLAKYAESAMAGACLIGDIPPDYATTIGPSMVQVTADMADNQIAQIVNKHLGDDVNLRARADGCRLAAMSHHTLDQYLDQLLEHLRELIRA
jgi:hypothetical protein